MLHPLTFAGNPPLTPTVQVPCWLAQAATDLPLRLAPTIARLAPEILATTPDPDWGPSSWLSSRFAHYNLFNYEDPALQDLEQFVREQYIQYMQATGQQVETCYIRAWANSYTRDTGLVWHNHFETLTGIDGPVWSHVSGNVCVQTFGTRTWYLSPFLGGVGHNAFGEGYDWASDVIGVDNVNGECLFFPSWLVHRTEKNQQSQPRITIAFDIITPAAHQAKQQAILFKRLI